MALRQCSTISLRNGILQVTFPASYNGTYVHTYIRNRLYTYMRYLLNALTL